MCGNQNNNHVQGSYRKLERRQRVDEKNAAHERDRHRKGTEAGKMAQHRIIAFRSPGFGYLPTQGQRTYSRFAFDREVRMLTPAHPHAMLFMNPRVRSGPGAGPIGCDQVGSGSFDPKDANVPSQPQTLSSRRLQPVRAAHLPPLQNNMSRAGGTLLGLSQWEGEKEGTSIGRARRMNPTAQTAGQLTDDCQPSAAPDRFRCRAIVRDPALYDVACKLQLHSQFWSSSVELCMSCHIGQ